MTQIKIAESDTNGRRRWAAFGFLLIVALTVIAWFVAPDVIKWVKSTFRQFNASGLTPIQLQLAFTAIVFVLLALLTGLIVTLFAPKKALNVKDKDLVKERETGEKYRRAQRKRQRRINRELREFNEKKLK